MVKLTDRTVKTAAPGRHMDGTVRGLTLLVWPTGARSWVLRYQLNGKRRDMGLGGYPDVSLARARQAARSARELIKADGRDPVAERRREAGLTFKAAAEALIESKESGWRNAKHRQQWTSTLKAFAYPKIGNLDVKAIDTRDVLAVLSPIWSETPETASRVRGRIEAVLSYAKAIEARTGDNPARWRGHLDQILAKPGKVRPTEHHPALDWREAPAFMAEIATRGGQGARALAFAILTAARSGEVRGMTWGEVDDDASVWTIPAARMKAGKAHRIPLTIAARDLLAERGPSEALVFPSPNYPSKPLTDTALTHPLRRMGHGELTAHGFRSTFRDWAGETTAHPREVIEHALAHGLKDQTEAAYARGDLFTKRRKLMQDWADFLARPAATVTDIMSERQEGASA